ncbi:hypothetical protein PROFUN_13168 [Planoprotostelium fungivorum]|uniref:X8 domain-containing protein n=1 Tax=Planoprotostelium fungivorum TaxID=1890364 RepID=A0A2P6N538_9EUKA|nr:hypothetical protein PROFUN_13168 [Planoprotostelium fungivorum]
MDDHEHERDEVQPDPFTIHVSLPAETTSVTGFDQLQQRALVQERRKSLPYQSAPATVQFFLKYIFPTCQCTSKGEHFRKASEMQEFTDSPKAPLRRALLRPQLPVVNYLRGIDNATWDGEGESVNKTPLLRRARLTKKKRRAYTQTAPTLVYNEESTETPAVVHRQRYKQPPPSKLSMSDEEEEHSTPDNMSETQSSKTDTAPDDLEMMEDEGIKCIVARSALILGFSYKRDGVQDKMHILRELQQKRTIVYNKETNAMDDVKMWKYRERLPKEVGDLNPLFRGVLGWKDPPSGPPTGSRGPKMKEQPEGTWTAHRMILNPTVLRDLFSDGKLMTVQNREEITYDVKIENIELMLYPLGSAFLVFHVDWTGGSNSLSLPDIRTLLFVSKYRHKLEGLSLGWCFTTDATSSLKEVIEDEKFGKYRYTTGDLFPARYMNGKVSLSCIGNWLLCGLEENPTSPPSRFDYPRHVLDKEPSSNVLQEYLFHLRRAFGQSNRPPIEKSTGSALGQTLIWRVNRYVGVSREGTVALSWPLSDNANDFERVAWHTKFQGIYLILQIHTMAEKLVFLELSDMAAINAERLQMVGGRESNSFDNIKGIRDQLRELSSRLVRYTISMSTNDCGGISEYSEFFGKLRDTFGIPELRNEISGELKDFLALLESFYWEEEKRKRDEASVQRQKAASQVKEDKDKRDAKDRRFELVVSILGSITVPFAVVGGIFGMNNDDVPTYIPFWIVMGVTGAFSLCLFLTMFLWRARLGDWIFSRGQQQRHQRRRERNNLKVTDRESSTPRCHRPAFLGAFGVSRTQCHRLKNSSGRVLRSNRQREVILCSTKMRSFFLLLLVAVALSAIANNQTLFKRGRKSNKCGVASDFQGNVGALTSGGAISWYYTWSAWKDGKAGGTEFVPMLWGEKTIGEWNNALGQGVFNDAKAVLGFNEPERGDQANMSPERAAQLWRQYMEPMKDRGKRLGAPVVSSAPEGKQWLQRFFSACGGCRIDFVPLHWYGGSAQNFINYVSDIHNSFGKPIWVTEWACVDYGDGRCDQNSVYSFMGQTTSWLDSAAFVERFAWFGVRVNGIPGEDALLDGSGNGRTALGNQYAVDGGHDGGNNGGGTSNGGGGDPCHDMYNGLQCRTYTEDPNGMDGGAIGNAFNWICSNYGSSCNDIQPGARYGGCNNAQRLSYIMNIYYQKYKGSQGNSACDFGGLGRVR